MYYVAHRVVIDWRKGFVAVLYGGMIPVNPLLSAVPRHSRRPGLVESIFSERIPYTSFLAVAPKSCLKLKSGVALDNSGAVLLRGIRYTSYPLV